MTIESATRLTPKYDAQGLLTVVITHAETGALLMVAHMNAAALAATQKTGKAHFWSRSRRKLWMKGEESGHILSVQDIRIDCDQDALWLKCLPAGPTCHTGAQSCFYRRVEGDRLIADDSA
ncbi:MAG: phosphoribosyl-AMP cyclohydrolase [Alphaproteobacteria bacterium]|nr:phosphoribosyl-AMP cyclohydrolase [Alphaproteobacteria bacterium]MDE2042926.1 phosphoribosyl-AMP cyclohydrolase [Alphaproteobacteria bacterium]MDE2340048.1 phosphoribosyl-AMP cyclohydrolase [Alphaproteobacteria bacterium]